MHDLSETIVAVATPPGRGGVGCVRLSGPRATEIAGATFTAAGDPPRSGGRPRFGEFRDRGGRPLDHGYVVFFSGDNAFTGERTAELWPHGSPAVLAELVAGATAHGARPAGPGEFAYRALRHGRLDLSRAEAIRDLVHARTIYQARVAFSQAEGAISERTRPLRELLEDWIARAEAAVEFVDESETHLPRGGLEAAIEQAGQECTALLDGFRQGRVVREGAALAIVGRPNVGKSSLFNALLNRNRAIVTDIPGTTRDTLEEWADMGGIPARLVDTAGLRAAANAVETEGVRRAFAAREEADIVLLVLDGSREPTPLELEALERARSETERQRTVVVVNKSDLERKRSEVGAYASLARVSALTGDRLDELREALKTRLVGAGTLEDPIITNERHAQALRNTLTALSRSTEALGSGMSEELVLEDLRLARQHLGEITGEFGTEALYDKIFSTFCVGK